MNVDANAGRESSHQPTIAIVIPYYQRKPGILARALRTITTQTGDAFRIHVIIVDDESPLDPELDISETKIPDDICLTLLRQPNGGPASARNAGLVYAEKAGARYVAFLDSDDEWRPRHLADAFDCLEQGSSFYFCDNIRKDQNGENALVGFNHNWPDRRSIEGISQLAVPVDAFSLPAETAFSEFLNRYLSQTSTVVYDLERHAGLRFEESLRGAGEDHLFWLNLALDSSRVTFTDRANVICGDGLNLYFSATDWAQPATRERFGFMALMYGHVLKRFNLDLQQYQLVSNRRKSALAVYSYLAFRNMLRGQAPRSRPLRSLISLHPGTILELPVLALSLVMMTPERRASFAEKVR